MTVIQKAPYVKLIGNLDYLISEKKKRNISEITTYQLHIFVYQGFYRYRSGGI